MDDGSDADWAELAEDAGKSEEGVNESRVVTMTKQYFWQDRARGTIKERWKRRSEEHRSQI